MSNSLIRYKYSSNSNRICIRYSSILLSKGVGAFGCLGQGNGPDALNDSNDFKPVEFTPSLLSDSEYVIQTSAGWGHSLAVTNHGSLYVFGRPYDFSNILQINRIRTLSHGIARLVSKHSNWFGIKHNNNNETISNDIEKDGGIYTSPMKVDVNNEHVLEAKASAGLSVLRTKSGSIYCFGLNRWGQCGTENKNNGHIYKPTKIVVPKQPKFMAFDVGLQHSLAVTENGDIYAWGKGNRGQLGNGDGDTSAKPVLVKLKAPKGTNFKSFETVNVSTGFNHSVALTKDGQVFIWGKGMSDVLKTNTKFYEDQITPRLLTFPIGIKAIEVCSSNFCTVIRCNNGSLWAVGMSEYDRSMIINPVPVFAPIPDHEDSNNVEKFPDVPLVIPSSAKLFKGHQRVVVFYDNNTSNKIDVYEIILHQGEAFAKELDISVPSASSSSSSSTVLDYSHGWQHSLILVK